jgi:hypothetical protein
MPQRKDPLVMRAAKQISLVASAVAVLLAACGADEGTTTPTSTVPTTTAVVVGAVTTSSQVVTDTDGTTSTVPEPTILAAADSLPSDDSIAAPSGALPMRSGLHLSAGTRYGTADLIGTAADVTMVGPDGGAYALSMPGVVGLTSDAAQAHAILQAFEMDFTNVFVDPNANVDHVGPSDTVAAPSDVLAAFVARPGVTADAVTETELGGLPAHKVHYAIVAFDGEQHCTATDASLCSPAFYDPIGIAAYYRPGDSGTMYELTVESRHLIVDFPDSAASTALQASIGWVVHRPSEVTADQVRLPYGGPLTADASYFWADSPLGTYVLRPVAGLEVQAYRQPVPFVEIGVGDVACMTVSDGTKMDWLGVPASPPPTTSSELPDDVLGALTALAGTSVVAAPSPFSSNGYTGTTLEMTATGPEVALLTGSLTLRPGVTTRITLIDRGPGQPPDEVMADVGSPCDSTAAGIQVLRGS